MDDIDDLFAEPLQDDLNDELPDDLTSGLNDGLNGDLVNGLSGGLDGGLDGELNATLTEHINGQLTLPQAVPPPGLTAHLDKLHQGGCNQSVLNVWI